MVRRYLCSLSAYTRMLRYMLVPNQVCSSIEDIDVDGLYRNGIRTILLDVDNTIMTHSDFRVSLHHVHWIELVKSTGHQVYLISNNSSRRRIARVARQLQVNGVYFALKPFSFSAWDMMYRYPITPSECVMIGDQLFTDVVFGNCLNMMTILVDPLDKKLSFLKTIQHEIELWLLHKLNVT